MSLDIPYIPFGTKGWGGQVGQRVVLRDTMGHPLFYFIYFFFKSDILVCMSDLNIGLVRYPGLSGVIL